MTMVISSSLVLFSPLYILLLSPQLCIICCDTPLTISVAFASMHVLEREWEKDNYICAKYENLRNTQWWCHHLSIPPSPCNRPSLHNKWSFSHPHPTKNKKSEKKILSWIKFLLFPEMKLSSFNIKKKIIFSQRKTFLIFSQRKTFLIFSQNKTFLIFS